MSANDVHDLHNAGKGLFRGICHDRDIPYYVYTFKYLPTNPYKGLFFKNTRWGGHFVPDPSEMDHGLFGHI